MDQRCTSWGWILKQQHAVADSPQPLDVVVVAAGDSDRSIAASSGGRPLLAGRSSRAPLAVVSRSC